MFQYLNDTYYIGYETELDGDYLPNSNVKICIINNDTEAIKKWAFEECCDRFESIYYDDNLKTHPDYLKFKNGERNVFLHNFDHPDKITNYSLYEPTKKSDPNLHFDGNFHEIQLIRKESGDCFIKDNQCDNSNYWYEYRWEIHEFNLIRDKRF